MKGPSQKLWPRVCPQTFKRVNYVVKVPVWAHYGSDFCHILRQSAYNGYTPHTKI